MDEKTLKIKTGIHSGKALGDAIADFTQASGLNKLAELYTDITGSDCGCEERKEFLNRLFPW